MIVQCVEITRTHTHIHSLTLSHTHTHADCCRVCVRDDICFAQDADKIKITQKKKKAKTLPCQKFSLFAVRMFVCVCVCVCVCWLRV